MLDRFSNSRPTESESKSHHNDVSPELVLVVKLETLEMDGTGELEMLLFDPPELR